MLLADPLKNELARKFYFCYFSGDKAKDLADDVVFLSLANFMRGMFSLEIKTSPENRKEFRNYADVKNRNLKIDLDEISLFFDTYVNIAK
jgi:hypothetical protein